MWFTPASWSTLMGEWAIQCASSFHRQSKLDILLSYLFASTFYLFIGKQLIVTAMLVRGVWHLFLKGLQAWDEHDVCWLQTGTSHKSKLWLNFVLYLILLCLPRLGCSTCLKYASWRSWLRNGWQGSWWGASRCTLNLLAPGHCLIQLE